jgi:hypothetical protein
MNPVTIVTKVAVATGRRLFSSYAKSGISSSIGRVVGSVDTVPSSSSSSSSSHLRKKQTTYTTGTRSSPLDQFIRQVAPGAAAAQRRTKSSLAVAIEHEESLSSSSINATTPNATYDQSVREPFPSIVIGPERSIEPQGSFAEAQAQVRHNDRYRKEYAMVYTYI